MREGPPLFAPGEARREAEEMLSQVLTIMDQGPRIVVSLESGSVRAVNPFA